MGFSKWALLFVAVQATSSDGSVAKAETSWVNERWKGGVGITERLMEGTFCTSSCARIEYCSCAFSSEDGKEDIADFLQQSSAEPEAGKGYLQYLDLWIIDNCPSMDQIEDPSVGAPCPDMNLVLFKAPDVKYPDPKYRQTVGQYIEAKSGSEVAGAQVFELSHFPLVALERKLEAHLALMSPDQVKRAKHVATRMKRKALALDSSRQEICTGIFNANHTCSGPHAHDICPNEHFCMATGQLKGCCKPCHECRHHDDAYPGNSCIGPESNRTNQSWTGTEKWCHDISPECPEVCQHARFDRHSELRL